jgi:ABC-type branched-subunit amino acid transport system substrate-binding protein
MTVAPLKVGILNDMSDGPSDIPSVEPWLRLASEQLVASGRLDRDVDFLNAWALGLPIGTAAAVERAFAELVEQGALLIVGPAIGDNALVATPLADRYQVPTINWAGTERARSEFMFHLQVGSHEDETVLLAQYLQHLGVHRVGVVHDRAPIARRYRQFFHNEADIAGLRISAVAPISELAEDVRTEVGEVLATGVDALVYLGLGFSAIAVARAVADSGWNGPRAMNTAGIRGYNPDFAKAIDGWTYIDMHSDGNRTLNALLQRTQLPSTVGSQPAKGYDLGRLVAEGLARATERTRGGVKEGLEQIKWLSAAEGKDGTLLGFGRHDRGALHGRYLVLRRWEAGRTVEL